MANMIVLWEGESIPDGWTLVSDSVGAFYQRFPRGAASYGATGGSSIHTHVGSSSWESNSTEVTFYSPTTVLDVAYSPHVHELSPVYASGSNMPSYRTLKVIRAAGIPTTLPAGAIVIFDIDTPTGFTRYSAQDNAFVYGEATAGTTGGSGTHTHLVSGTSGYASIYYTDRYQTFSDRLVSKYRHTHTIEVTTPSAANNPPSIAAILAKADSSIEPPCGTIALFDSAPGRPWNIVSKAGYPFYLRFIKPSATFGAIADTDYHQHASAPCTSSENTLIYEMTAGVSYKSGGPTHTHPVTVTTEPQSVYPSYIDAIYGRKSLSYPPKRKINGHKFDALNSINNHQKTEMEKFIYRVWTQKVDFGGIARGEAAGFVLGGYFYLGTGLGADGYGKLDFWQYNPETDTWAQKANVSTVGRALAVGFSDGDYGYITTGYTTTYTKETWRYDVGSNSWAQRADFGGTARWIASGFAIGSYGYVGGGHDGAYKLDWWRYDPSANSWAQKADFGGGARYGASAFSLGSYGYVGCGASATALLKDFWLYTENTWTQKADLDGLARYGACGYSNSNRNRGYISCGDCGFTVAVEQRDIHEYDPTANTWSGRSDYGSVDYNLSWLVGGGIGTECYMATGMRGTSPNYVMSSANFEYSAVYLGIS